MTQTPIENAQEKANGFYTKIRSTANSRLSFVQSGAHGSQADDGPISQPSLSEMFDVTFQRLEFVLRSLVEHSELPEQIHALSLQESSESKLAATTSTAYFLWLLAELSELMNGGDLHTVGPLLENMTQHVGPHTTSQNTSSRNPPRTQSLRSTSIPGVLNGERVVFEQPLLPGTSSDNGKKSKNKKKGSTSKSPRGKKAPSVKKKRKKSTKRSGRK